MGDRSYTAITVYACPEEHRHAVLEAIEWNLQPNIVPDGAADGLVLGDTYAAEELSLGDDDTLASALEEISPDITFDLQQEPKYEFLGNRNIQVAGLGRVSFPCTSDGDPVVVWSDVDAALTEIASRGDLDMSSDDPVSPTQLLDDVRERLSGLFERQHVEAIKVHADATFARLHPEAHAQYVAMTGKTPTTTEEAE